MYGPEKPRILNEHSVTLQNPLVVLGRQDFLLHYWAEEGDKRAAEIFAASAPMTLGFYIEAIPTLLKKQEVLVMMVCFITQVAGLK